MKVKLKTFVALLMCAFVFTIPAVAQTINGNIVGFVADEQGAAVPGATVTATNVATGAVRTAETNNDGLYRIAGLPVGIYKVVVEKAGFAVATAPQVNVNVGIDSNADFTLRAGPVAETVTVVATGALLDTTQSQVAKTVDQTKILELPGRNTLNGLALLQPGVLPNLNGRPGSGFAVNGNRTRSNNFTIDGANNNDQSLSIPRQSLPPEAIGEFQIVTNSPSAEFGRNAGSYVNQITKSGTNEFHGIGFWMWDGNGLDALSTSQERTFRANLAAGRNKDDARRAARSPNVSNTYGFTLGGPVKKNHTFFFSSVDFNDFRTTISSRSRAALTQDSLNFLQANRSRFNPAAIDFILRTFPAANDPTFAGGTAAGSTITARDINGNAVGNVVFQTFNRTLAQGLPYGNDFDRYLAKINTKINNNDQLSFRYLYSKSNDPGQPATLPGLEIGSVVRNDSFTVNDVYAISPTLINEARFTYSRRDAAFPENLEAFAAGNQISIGGSFSAFNGGSANFPQNRLDHMYEFTENMSFTRGNHNMKWGVNVLRYQLNSFFAPNSRGFVSYSSFNNFLNDVAQLIQKANGEFRTNEITYENSFFFQDDYRFNPDLTFNLGMRYEYVTAPAGYFSNAKPDINNFGPRVGFAWNPKNMFDGRLVWRGGFGISYDQVFQNILLNNSRNYPRVANFAIAGTGLAPFLGYNQPQLAALNAEPSTIPESVGRTLALRLFSPNQRIEQPMSYQWNTGLQYQIGNDYVFKAEYIGTKGSNLVRELEQNIGFCGANNPLSANRVPCTSANVNSARLDPTRGSILVGGGFAGSIYHSGQFTFEKRFGNMMLGETNLGGLSFNTNFTYSMFISESDDILGGQTNRTLPADPRVPGADRARSGFDQPRRFIASYLWTSPEVFRDNAILGRLLSDWSISGVTTLADGTPFTILSANNQLGIIPGQISTVQLSQRPLLLNPNARDNSFTVASVVNGQLVFPNPSARYALLPSDSGFAGNLGANTERTGGLINTNLAAVKNFRTFSESQKLQLRAEVFNVFNRRNFLTIPTNTISSTLNPANFLNYGLTDISGRSFLFGARYYF